MSGTDGRNYLRIIFLKNIDFSVKTVCKDKSLQKCLHKDALEEDFFTASIWKFFLKKFVNNLHNDALKNLYCDYETSP